jgi:hypothetical protein
MGDILVEDVRTKVERVPTVARPTWSWSSIRHGTRA